MVIAAEFTTATLVAWVLIGLAVGFIVGWLLRPWLVRDRLTEEYEERLAAQRGQLDATKEELADVTAGLAEASTDREAARADVVRLEAELTSATARTAELEREVETVALEKDAEIERLGAQAGKVGALEARIAELEGTSTSLEASQAEVARLEAELESATGKLAAAETDAAAKIAEKDAEIERIGADAEKASGLEGRIAELEAANAELDETLEGERSRLHAELEQERMVAAELRSRVTALENDDSADRAAALQSDLDACRAAVADRDRTIAELESAAAAADDAGAPSVEPAVIAAAPRLAVVPDAPEPEAVQPEPEPPAAEPKPAVEPAPDKETATRKVAEIATRTRGGGPRVEDDLQRIRGIGPKIAGLLRGMDITSFRQIARFEQDDIAYVAAALDAFPDRIGRDDWMSSAALLHEEKYGEPA